MSAPRILILRGGAIGDFIVTLPVLNLLRVQWPGASIEVACYPRVSPLVRISGLAQKTISLDHPQFARLFHMKRLLEEEECRWFAGFDLVLSFLYDPDGLIRRALEVASVRNFLECDPRPIERHATDHLVHILESLAIYEDHAIPALEWPQERVRMGRDLLEQQGIAGRAFAIHPGSGAKGKNWPIDRYLAFATRLRVAGWTPYFILGEAEEGWDSVIRDTPEAFPCIRPELLESTADILSASRAYLGNDSGISHLAAALGLDALILFGPSRPETWGPRGRGKVRSLRKGPRMADLDLEDVLQGAQLQGWL